MKDCAFVFDYNSLEYVPPNSSGLEALFISDSWDFCFKLNFFFLSVGFTWLPPIMFYFYSGLKIQRTDAGQQMKSFHTRSLHFIDSCITSSKK